MADLEGSRGQQALQTLRARLAGVRIWFSGLRPESRGNLVKGVLVGGSLLALFAAYYLSGRDKVEPANAPKEKVAVIQLGDSRLEDDIRSQVERERVEQRQQNEKQDESIESQKEQLTTQAQEIATLQSVLKALGQGGSLDFPSAAELAGQAKDSKVPQTAAEWEQGATKSGATLAGGQPGAEAQPPQPTFVGDIGVLAPPANAAAPAKKKTRKFFLPVSFIPAKVLTGLNAKTVDSAKEDPEQIGLRVQAPAILPNDVRAALEGCIVVAHGYGSLASERVEARLVSLSCVDFEGRSVIEQEITGIVTDQDGVKGLTARPVSKMGAHLARLALAGFVEGASQAFQQTAVTTSISPLGQTQTIDTDKIARAGAGRGMGNASSELTKMFADLARQAAPVLEMGPTKDVTVFITQGVWLEVKDYEQET